MKKKRRLTALVVLLTVYFGSAALSQDTRVLLREYEPIIYLHPWDGYVPMNLEPYVEERCSLWHKDMHSPTVPEGELELAFLGDPSIENWSDFYLWFDEESKPPFPLSIEPRWGPLDEILRLYAIAAFREYRKIKDKSVIYYGRQIEDNGYIVLQYWFFYAYNPWGAYEFGINIHEGDWEMICIFLEPQGEEPIPRYAAYSAHNDRGAEVTRPWNEVEKAGKHPILYVSWGSHAGCFDNGWNGLHKRKELPGLYDITSPNGLHIGPGQDIEWDEPFILEDANLPLWADKYSGRWGADWGFDDRRLQDGLSGPRGPRFQGDRWEDPADWAGLEPIANAFAVADMSCAPSGIAQYTFSLGQNFRNPFNPDTWIPYTLARDVDVIIRIYNLPGQLVRTLDTGNQAAGSYVTKASAAYWDGKNEANEEVASGIYLYTIQAGEFAATRKMLMLK